VPDGEKTKIAVTCGDPAGIGPELMLRLLAEPSVLERCVPAVFADAGVLERVAVICGLPGPSRVLPVEDWAGGRDVDEPTVVDCRAIAADGVEPGRVSALCGRAAYTYVERAVRAVMDGRLDAVATGPIHKESLRLAGIPQPGHTEILAELTGASRSCMLLTSDRLSVSFVTTHVGYAEVPELISRQRVLDVIELTAEAMTALRGRPVRLTVCGLNPHAGEGGLFGNREEERHILPALEEARAQGIAVEGPTSADAAFLPHRMEEVDAIVCMYHDQGHIPFKQVAFDSGVNVTLGLPIIRTSVDHGTAFDIAWKGVAQPTSIFHVIALTVRLVRKGRTAGERAT
jgi:4-hydroxythreonine-4-phosphate dehydrogenase